MTNATYDILVIFELLDVPSIDTDNLNREISYYFIILFVNEYSTFLS